ncbi:phage integrase N-terminal domain-containing protein [Psychrobacter sp.]|uniref:phage integrase N-terminal domain-containing protein n=1 Tax=Psychrobacter sp. TaxID=56811 RepID=UPI0025EAD423|nr:phage integrase N-terminal domain-containing protein [Psychrobacter sp.]
MKKLEHKILQICSRNRDGSYATQANRRSILSLCVSQLDEAGYKVNELKPHDLKGRHINALVKRWKNEGVSNGTIKNRMSALRWLAEKIDNRGLVKSNDELGIANRKYITNKDKSIDLVDLSKVDLSKLSPHVLLSNELQKEFGLRREEAMKFMPSYALGGYPPHAADKIMIKPSWSKGGRYREIPILNSRQVQLLERVQALAKDGSLIPVDKSYKQHKNTFEYETRKAGIGQTHGLRHLYAQNRYLELTGLLCPAVGGVRELSDNEKKIDRQARLQISSELGHSRLQITGVYLGSWSYK